METEKILKNLPEGWRFAGIKAAVHLYTSGYRCLLIKGNLLREDSNKASGFGSTIREAVEAAFYKAQMEDLKSTQKEKP